jgi:Outer membrane protein beta-barrel domain
MESLNHDMHDMDALFRKAAEGYPLKAGDGNWENISGKLLTKQEKISSTKKSKRGKYFGLLLLLFLLTGTLLFYPEFQYRITSNDKQGNNKDIFNKDVPSSTIRESKGNSVRIQGDDRAGRPNTQQLARNLTKEGRASRLRNINVEADDRSRELIKSVGQSTNQRFTFLPGPVAIPGPTSLSGHIFLGQFSSSLPNLQNADTGAVRGLANQNNKGFYFGPVAGFDFSKVKSQAVNKTGYNLGLLAGYRFNRRLSVESGILLSKKKYYSNGKYFNMNKVGPSMPSNMKIVTVDGQFTLLKIPFKFKYDFVPNKKSNLFISTGIVSSIYLKEQNSYLTEMNNVREYHTGVYKDVSYSWISSVSISAGYEHQLGKSRTMRLEPYIEIPLKEAGMGSMSVFSAGINISTSNLFSKKTP